MIRVRFQDHGIGIAAKHLPFIFRAILPGSAFQWR